MQKEKFKSFLREFNFPHYEELLDSFQRFLDLLLEENSKVNLISRKTKPEDYWTTHFLDSILPIRDIDFSNKKILDFGTGGGLPGIPIKLLYPDSIVFLLDSKQKKINSIKNIVKRLDLKECFTIVSRLEEMEADWNNFFDIIVCRSVKILPKYKIKMFDLLKNDGKIILYKSRKLDDVTQFGKVKIYDVSRPEIGERKIIEIVKK